MQKYTFPKYKRKKITLFRNFYSLDFQNLTYGRIYSHSGNSKLKIWFSAHLIVICHFVANLGCASESKINQDLFCASLGFH